MSDINELVERAKLAEQAERYDDMASVSFFFLVCQCFDTRCTEYEESDRVGHQIE